MAVNALATALTGHDLLLFDDQAQAIARAVRRGVGWLVEATAQGTDDDGNHVMAMDDATVSFNNVIPDADLTKDATSAVVTYQLTVTVSGSGGAESLVIRDPLPAELEYQAGTLSVSGSAEDDDFAPAGTDNSGFDAGNTSLVIDRGAVAGGSPDIVITFDAALR